ncbi:MAG: FAD binding domain-containing protein [Spirochaetaceae bacterium]
MRNFRFLQPKGYDSLLRAKEEERETAFLLAGGTNLLSYIKMGRYKEGLLIDATRIDELKGIEETKDALRIGAGVTMAELLENTLVGEKLPYFQETLFTFANPLIRNKATLGGNLADASPIADTAPILLALDAQVVAASAKGTRVIELKDFFTGVNKTSLKPEELIESILVPLGRGTKAKMVKLGLRNGYSCSVSSAAVGMELDGDTIKDLRIALGGVAPIPVRAGKCEKALIGTKLEGKTVAGAAEKVNEDISPISDVRGSAEYRRGIAISQVKQAIAEAAGMEV